MLSVIIEVQEEVDEYQRSHSGSSLSSPLPTLVSYVCTVCMLYGTIVFCFAIVVVGATAIHHTAMLITLFIHT